nr:hypothetical protein BaRGS_023780 [Batillaria attramentaria]
MLIDSHSVCRTENLDLVVQPLEEEIIDDYGDRVLYAILGGDSEGLREILHSSADRRVPHLALAQALLLKDQQHSTACLAVLLEHHSGADHVDEPGLLAKAGNSDFPPVIKSRMDDLEWEEIEAFGGAYKLAPIHLAAARGARTSQRDNQGNTALHLAAEQGNHEVVSLLLDHGASPLALNEKGKWPLLRCGEMPYCVRGGVVQMFHRH